MFVLMSPKGRKVAIFIRPAELYSIFSMIRRILIIVGYFAAFVLVAFLTVILVAYGRGYSYDFKTGQIVHNGLLLLSSQPGGAEVTIKGRSAHYHTPKRLTLPAGRYQVTATKPGYRTWQKTVRMVASEVTFAEYILLVPDQLKFQKMAAVSSPVVAESHDLHHLAFASGQQLEAGATDGQPKAIWHLPDTPAAPDINNPAAGQMTALAWSDDNSRLLVTVESQGQSSYWVVWADGSKAVNLTDQFKFDFSGGLVFTPGDAGKLYWLSPDGLRQLDMGAQTVSGVLADQVVQMIPAADRLFYVQQTPLGRALMSMDHSGHKVQAVQVLPVSQSYSVAFTSQQGHDFLAVAPSQTHTATLYLDPYGSHPTTTVISTAANAVSFSTGGTYLLAEGGESAVYDINRSLLVGAPVIYPLSGVANVPSVAWYDDNHLVYQSGSDIWLCEFDGANATRLTDGNAASPAYPLPSSHGLELVVSKDGQNELDRVIIRP